MKSARNLFSSDTKKKSKENISDQVKNFIEENIKTRQQNLPKLKEKIKQMLEENPSFFNTRISTQPSHYTNESREETTNYTPLALAVHYGAYTLTQALIETGADISGIQREYTVLIHRFPETQHHCTVLEWAVTQNRIEITKLLLKKGADPFEHGMHIQRNSNNELVSTENTFKFPKNTPNVLRRIISLHSFKHELKQYAEKRAKQSKEYEFSIELTLFGKEYKFNYGMYTRTQKLAAESAMQEFLNCMIEFDKLKPHLGALRQGNLGKLTSKYSVLFDELKSESENRLHLGTIFNIS